MPQPPSSPFEAAVAAEQVRLHGQVWRLSLVGSAVIGTALALMLADTIGAARAYGWLAVLAVALALRVAVVQLSRRAGDADAADWRRRHRAAYFLHGLVWAWAAAAIFVLPAGVSRELLMMALGAIVAGSLLSTSYDIVAALLFGLPAAAPAVLHLLSPHNGNRVAPVLMALLLTTTVVIAALRAHGTFRRAVGIGLRAEQSRAAAYRMDRALADKHQLLEQLLRRTEQGFWFLDDAGVTTDANPALCRMLGLDRQAVLGRALEDFFTGADLEEVRRLVATTRDGRQGDFEINVGRPDGTWLCCLVHAAPLLDASGRRTGSIGIWTDITERHRAEAARHIHEVVTNATADLISVIDGDEVYRMVNEAWCRVTGLTRDAVVGRRLADIAPFVRTPERARAMQDCLRHGQRQTVRDTLRLAGGLQRHLLTNYYPLDGDRPGTRQVALVTRDITAEQQAVEAVRSGAAAQRDLLDAFPGYIAVLDGDDRYTYVNDRLAALWGIAPGSVIGRPAREVLGEARYSALSTILEKARRDGQSTTESHYDATVDRPTLDLEVSHIAGLARPGQRATVYAFGADITERKRAQSALVAALADAEQANRAKTLFLSNMSHELRTPLNAILGFGELLATDKITPLTRAQQAQVQEILRGGRHLLALISDLLDLGRIEVGELHLECTALAADAAIDEAIALVLPLASQRGITVRRAAPSGLNLMADPRRLRQVLLNLLGNAIKYNRDHGRVEVGIAAEGSQVVLRVTDTGNGLSAEDQLRLFRPFERLGARHGPQEGTGIGLALSRRLVEAMGGTIGVDSRVGEGSTFWMRFEAADKARLQAAEEYAPHGATLLDGVQDLAGTLLYIEDNPVNLILMEAMLARLPEVRLIVADTPWLGLERAASVLPDMILLDIQLPEIDGYEVLRRLRAEPRTSSIPVVAVSANALPSDLAAGQAAGFDAYLTKPLDFERLLQIIQRTLGPTARAAQDWRVLDVHQGGGGADD